MSKTKRITTLEVGETYLIQSCTKDWVGRVIAIDGPYSVTLEDASWVADSGRLHAFLRDGRADGMEVEMLPPGTVMGVQWVNWIHWPHPVPLETV